MRPTLCVLVTTAVKVAPATTCTACSCSRGPGTLCDNHGRSPAAGSDQKKKKKVVPCAIATGHRTVWAAGDQPSPPAPGFHGGGP